MPRSQYSPYQMAGLLRRLGVDHPASATETYHSLHQKYGWSRHSCRRFARWWREDKELPPDQRRGFPSFQISGTYVVASADAQRWLELMRSVGVREGKQIASIRCRVASSKVEVSETIARAALAAGVSSAAVRLIARDLI